MVKKSTVGEFKVVGIITGIILLIIAFSVNYFGFFNQNIQDFLLTLAIAEVVLGIVAFSVVKFRIARWLGKKIPFLKA
jgi:hypothetical protein